MICIHWTELFCSLCRCEWICYIPGIRPRLPLFPAPRVEGAAVARVRELGLHQLGQALQRREGLQGEGCAGFQEPHLPQTFRGEGSQSCGGNIPESHTQRT